MNARNTRTEIETRLLAGETVEAIAAALSLDVVDDETGTPMVAFAGWFADDGNAEVEYECADSGKEAAEEYVADGDWGDDTDSTGWVTVYTWRRGLRRAECCACSALATSHIPDGRPACVEHADTPEELVGAELEPLVIECATDRRSHKIEIEPTVPDCADGQEHDWASPHEMVGGLEENPGVCGNGGGVISHSVCLRCGCGRTIDTWAQDLTDGQQGLTSTSYEAGEYSADLAKRRDRLVREALADIIEAKDAGDGWRTSVECASDEDGTDEDADAMLEEIRDAVGGACDVEWTGNSNTDRDGVDRADVSIEWREGATARREALARATQEAQ